MPVNFRELFGLNQNFTKDELKKSLVNKIHYIDSLSISPVEKKYLLEMYHYQYNIAKDYLENKNFISKPNSILGLNFFDPTEHYNFINKQHDMMLKQFEDLKLGLGSNGTNKGKSNIYSSSYSYQSSLNPDGTRTVIESKGTFNNGKSDKKINSYQIDSKGNKKPININDAQKYIGHN